MTVISPAITGNESPAQEGWSAPAMLMLFFMLTTVLVPTTILNKILFAVLLAWSFGIFVRYRSPRPELVGPLVAVIGIFLYGLILAISGDNDRALAFQFFLAVFVLTLIHFVLYFQIDMDRASEVCGKAIVIATAVYASLVYIPGLPFAADLVAVFDTVSAAANAERDFSDTATSTIAVGTVPFLFVPFCITLMRVLKQFRITDFFWLTLYTGTIVASGARGVIVIALAFMVLAAIRLSSNLIRFAVIVAAAALFFIVIPEILANTSVFSDEETSNSTKLGHYYSYIDHLNTSNGMFGEGLGSYYYSSGRGILLPHTEITPLDLSRYFGIPLATIFYLLLFIPRIKVINIRDSKILYNISFFLYLILSITNPVLVNSYGMIVVVWYWSKILPPHNLANAVQS